MKHKNGMFIPILAVVLVVGLVILFWNPILDALPVDQSRWKESGGKTYYYDEKGDLVTGWLELEGSRYHLGSDGAMATGWAEIGGSRYWFGANGAMHTGWLEQEGNTYYMNPDGTLATGWVEADGSRYYFDTDGTRHTGWLTTDQGTYCMDANGVPLTGWADRDGVPCYLDENGSLVTGWLEIDGSRYYFDADGAMATGWLTTGEGTYYLNEDGTMRTGWLETDGGRFYLGEDGVQRTGRQTIDGTLYYLNADGSTPSGWVDTGEGRCYLNGDGSLHTGWLELDGQKYYLKEDGTAAVGKLVIDGETHYFVSSGAEILLVNRWNTLDKDYVPENMVRSASGVEMVEDAAAALDAMVEACRAAGYRPKVRTAYRDYAYQSYLLNNKVAEGYTYAEAIQIVAIPGTSEHQTGLAVDISDSTYTYLNAAQGDTAIQGWLHEHCWEYGFIVRYPDGTTDITGIICESWHYRYVGVELAKEIWDLGICLEEYLDMLTNDGTTCGDPDSLS